MADPLDLAGSGHRSRTVGRAIAGVYDVVYKKITVMCEVIHLILMAVSKVRIVLHVIQCFVHYVNFPSRLLLFPRCEGYMDISTLLAVTKQRVDFTEVQRQSGWLSQPS